MVHARLVFRIYNNPKNKASHADTKLDVKSLSYKNITSINPKKPIQITTILDRAQLFKFHVCQTYLRFSLAT